KKIIYGVFKPRRANGIVRGVEFVDHTCGAFIAGKVLDSLIVGIVCYISMLILRMPYGALIAMIVGVTNIIPFFGPFIGAIPCALILIFISPIKCLIFIIYIIVLQQIDGNIIGPRILGNSIGLSGFWILFALLFFGSIFGFWGMLLGVPVFSVIYEGIKRLVRLKLRKKALSDDTEDYKRLEQVDVQTNTMVRRQEQTQYVIRRRRRRKGGKGGAGEDEHDPGGDNGK
ncbi:MAG: AI-2E family transporter, partial [Oscillospiraceae bacterium]|nr:AI-2E family transporter [Oscillospiraceae bacterium]